MTTTTRFPTATELDRLCVDTIRMLSIDAVEQANSGHPGTPMALASIGYVLFTRVMRHSSEQPDWPDRDRFVLSAGHASMLLYSLLYLAGYGLTLDDLRSFRQLGSPAAGHPERGLAPGIETTTGPLGQGIATSVGLVLGERMLNARLGDDLIDHHTFCIASDGDMQEGISSEACSLAGHLALGRLIVFYDDNHISIEGPTSLAFSENVGARYRAYGWHVQNLGENLALDAIEDAARTAMSVKDRPSLIICRTPIAPGAPHKQDTAAAHGAPLGEEEVRLTKRAYGWAEEEPFHVPEEARAHFRAVPERGAELYREWQERLRATSHEHPELANELGRLIRRQLPEGWDEGVPRFHATGTMTPTRKSSHAVLQWAAARVPELVGGSADLAPSTLTVIDGADDVQPGAYAGRNLHFGIREHAMGAIVNGLTLHYLRAYGSTFLVFSDYMRGAIRLAALMGVPSIFVFTHDSIGLGEDGPTHQPIEQLAGLRAMPGLAVIRPAGANRDGTRVALRDRDDGAPERADPLAPGSPDMESGGRSRRRDRARGLRAARLVSRAAPAGADPDRDRLRGSHLCASRRRARGRGDRHPPREHAMRGELHRTGAELPRPGAAAGSEGARVARSGEHQRLVPVGRKSGRGNRDAELRRLRPRRCAVQALWAHAGTRRARRPQVGEAGP